ncbi:MAG: DegV family protein [Clostridium sp.]|uniref:DegV family protein n=1 Tax=Clostridium sp. TaxID=1506 RepID=UPI003038B97C
MGIKIVTDSTSYIPKELIKKYDITVVSLGIVMDGDGCKEVEICNDEFYRKLSQLENMPTSSQPTIEDLYSAFEKIIAEGNEAVGIFISSDMSGTYSTCNQIVSTMIMEKYPNAKMEVLDSKSNCMQMGYAVIEAAKLAMEGKDIEAVVEGAKNLMTRSRFLFVPDTLEYLKKGGRIGGAAALFGTLLKIRPILTVEDGKTTVFDKVRTKQKAIQKILNKIDEDIKNNELGELIIHHINCEEEGKALADKVKEVFNIDAEIQCIGPVIGCHVGPKTVGIAYYTKR